MKLLGKAVVISLNVFVHVTGCVDVEPVDLGVTQQTAEAKALPTSHLIC